MARWIRPERRERIVARGEHRCCYCGQDGLLLAAPAGHPLAATLDHVTPRAHGGTNEPTNLVCSCLSCNSRRQDTRLNTWALMLGTERAEAAVGSDVTDRAAVVAEMAEALAAAIVRRVRSQARRALPALAA